MTNIKTKLTNPFRFGFWGIIAYGVSSMCAASLSLQEATNKDNLLLSYNNPGLRGQAHHEMVSTQETAIQVAHDLYKQMESQRNTLLSENERLKFHNSRLQELNNYLIHYLETESKFKVQQIYSMPLPKQVDESRNHDEKKEEEQGLASNISHVRQLNSCDATLCQKSNLEPSKFISSTSQEVSDPDLFKELYDEMKKKYDDLMEKYTVLLHENNDLFNLSKELQGELSLKSCYTRPSQQVDSSPDLLNNNAPHSTDSEVDWGDSIPLPSLHNNQMIHPYVPLKQASINKKRKNGISSVHILSPELFPPQFKSCFLAAFSEYYKGNLSKYMPLNFLNPQKSRGKSKKNAEKNLYKGVVYLIQGIFKLGIKKRSFSKEVNGLIIQVVQYYKSSFVLIYRRDKKDNNAMEWSYESILPLESYSPLMEKMFGISIFELKNLPPLTIHSPLPGYDVINIRPGAPLIDVGGKVLIKNIRSCKIFPYICVKNLTMAFFIIHKKIRSRQRDYSNQVTYDGYRSYYDGIGKCYRVTKKVPKWQNLTNEIIASTGLLSLMYAGVGVAGQDIDSIQLTGWKLNTSKLLVTLLPDR